ncbi:MAG: PEGA domain-containing protein, partial [Polyangiales bacterium]
AAAPPAAAAGRGQADATAALELPPAAAQALEAPPTEVVDPTGLHAGWPVDDTHPPALLADATVVQDPTLAALLPDEAAPTAATSATTSGTPTLPGQAASRQAARISARPPALHPRAARHTSSLPPAHRATPTPHAPAAVSAVADAARPMPTPLTPPRRPSRRPWPNLRWRRHEGGRRLWLGAGITLAAVVGLMLAWRALAPSAQPQIHVEIVSNPAGATVTLDGQSLARKTPLVLDDSVVDPGRTHHLQLQLKGHEVWETRFQVTRGVTTQIAVLRPLRAAVQITTQPPGAEIWVNGMTYGLSPVDVAGFAVGDVLHVRATKEGYRDARATLRIKAGQLDVQAHLPLQRR